MTLAPHDSPRPVRTLVQFDYRDDSKLSIAHLLGGTIEFEDQISNACLREPVTDVVIQSMTPGLSGAAVFLVRRLSTGIRYSPWVVKISDNPALIITERSNNVKYVQGKIGVAPQLIETGSSRILIFVCGGGLSDFEPLSLRVGYLIATADALANLMTSFVKSVRRLHHFREDGTSCVDRMPLLRSLHSTIHELDLPLSADLQENLLDSWEQVYQQRHIFPRFSSTGHGDLNAGNILFDPTNPSAYPVIIDFASMERSKDNENFPSTQHFPFWDFAKLERDIQTRLFLKNAFDQGMDDEEIIKVVKAVSGCEVELGMLVEHDVVIKFLSTLESLRTEIKSEYSPRELQAYRIVQAYAMLTVLLRRVYDTDVPRTLQLRVAAEASICLLSSAMEPLPMTRLFHRSDSSHRMEDNKEFAQPGRLVQRLATRTWERDATQEVSRQKTLLIVAIERVVQKLASGLVIANDLGSIQSQVVPVRSGSQLNACGRINAQAYSGNRWGGSGLSLEDNILEKTERNRNHLKKCPKALFLLKAMPVEGFVPSKGYIGFTHLIPLNKDGLKRYCDGEIEDNILGSDVICALDEPAAAILLFSMALDPTSIDVLYRSGKRVRGEHPTDFRRFRYLQFEKLIQALTFHTQQIARDYGRGQPSVRVLVQAVDDGEMVPAIKRAGFQKTEWVSGDHCPIWELQFAVAREERNDSV